MKNLRPILGVASLALLGSFVMMPWEASAGTNRWTTEGPFGGVVLDLARDANDPDVLYAATDTAGVWKSVNGAHSWFPVNSGLDRVEQQTTEIETHPTVSGTVYLATTDGLRRSTDGGMSWSQIGTTLPVNGRFAVAPSNGEILYYGADSEGLFRSQDGGLSWSALGFALSGRAWDIAVDPNDPNTVYVNSGSDGLYKSTDGGLVWQRSDQVVDLGNLRYSGDVVIDPNDSDHLYWIHDFEVYRSQDGGNQWRQVSPFALRFESAAFDPRVPGRIYLGADLADQVLWSDDGVQWFSSILEGRPRATLADFAFGGEGTETLYLAERRGDGVYRNDGSGWQLANQGMTAATVWDFAFDPGGQKVYAAVFNGIHRREAPGAPWELLLGSREQGDCCQLVRVDPSQPDLLYAGSVVRGVLRSLDGGETWEPANVGRESALAVYDLALNPLQPSTLYLAAFDGVYRSDDRAQTWRRLDFGVPVGPAFHVLVDPEDPSILYAGTQRRALKSLDGGSTWTLLDGLSTTFLSDLTLDPNDPSVVYAATSTTLEVSRDGGATWSQLTAGGLPGHFFQTVVVDPADSSTLYVGTLENLWRSTDGGATFETLEGGLDRETLVLSIAFAPGPVRTIYAGLDEGAAVSLTRGCIDQEKVLCLDDQAGDKRFAVSIHYDTDLGGGFEGDAQATSLAPIGIADGGILSFFEPSNPEALVKLINGCGFNDRYWVFAAATTSVGFELKVEDTLARETQVYTNPDDNPADTLTDTEAFATCDAGIQEPGDDAGASAEPHGDPGPRSVAANRRSLAGPAKTDGEGCVADANTLCIDDEPGDRRFAVRLHFDSALGGGQEGDAMATSLAPLGITDGGILSFFQVSLPEVLVKVIDGCGFNGAYWVFYAATTNLGFEMTVEDTLTGVVRTYENPDGQPAATITDVKAFEVCGS